MVCNSIFSLFLSRVFVFVFSSSSMKIYLRVKLNFTLRLFKRKTWFTKLHFWATNPNVIFWKLLKSLNYWRKEKNGGKYWKNRGNFSSYFSSKARCTCDFIRNNKSLKLVGHIKILLSIITGILDSFLNSSIDY